MKLVCGLKGSGKTERLVNQANLHCSQCKGVLVYIDRTNHRMHDLDRKIRLVDISEYHIKTVVGFLAFVKGMMAVNYDIEHIYCDEIVQILKLDLADSQELFEGMLKIEQEFHVEFAVAVTLDGELPEFLANIDKI